MSNREADLERCLEEAALYKARVEAGFRVLREALEFYADPDTYFAVSFFADPPCGEFVGDFEEIDGRRRPGRRARGALDATAEVCPRPPEED